MTICNNCQARVAGYPKICPACKEKIDYNTAQSISYSPIDSIFLSNSSLSDLARIYDTVIAFDTETTGLDFEKNRIIELSCVVLSHKPGREPEFSEADIFIKLPFGEKIPENIVELTSITDEMLESEGVEEAEAVKIFASMLCGRHNLLVAHNAQFDMNFLYYLLKRNNSISLLTECDMLDTLTIYKDRHPYPHKLCNAIEEYRLENVANTHRAIDDTRALCGVLTAMNDELSDVGNYINLFGYNEKYGISGKKISSVKYLPQGYKTKNKLYERV